MADDIVLQRRNLHEEETSLITEKQLQFYVLAEIDKLLKSVGKSLKQYNQLPQPSSSYIQSGKHNLLIEETSYNMRDMALEFNRHFLNCNSEQLEVYHAFMSSVESNTGETFLVYGSGGCGKTYIWKTLIYKLRSIGKIVLPVASSGIVATLMPGGTTAHSRFKIPIILDDYSSCANGHESDIVELIRNTDLIIWDEAPMQHRYAFECLDRSIRDIMRSVDANRYHLPFGGVTVLLGGDFWQILPIIAHASRGEIVFACITRSPLWKHVKIFLLHQNMRLTKGNSAEEVEELRKFAKEYLK